MNKLFLFCRPLNLAVNVVNENVQLCLLLADKSVQILSSSQDFIIYHSNPHAPVFLFLLLIYYHLFGQQIAICYCCLCTSAETSATRAHWHALDELIFLVGTYCIMNSFRVSICPGLTFDCYYFPCRLIYLYVWGNQANWHSLIQHSLLLSVQVLLWFLPFTSRREEPLASIAHSGIVISAVGGKLVHISGTHRAKLNIML